MNTELRTYGLILEQFILVKPNWTVILHMNKLKIYIKVHTWSLRKKKKWVFAEVKLSESFWRKTNLILSHYKSSVSEVSVLVTEKRNRKKDSAVFMLKNRANF